MDISSKQKQQEFFSKRAYGTEGEAAYARLKEKAIRQNVPETTLIKVENIGMFGGKDAPDVIAYFTDLPEELSEIKTEGPDGYEKYKRVFIALSDKKGNPAGLAKAAQNGWQEFVSFIPSLGLAISFEPKALLEVIPLLLEHPSVKYIKPLKADAGLTLTPELLCELCESLDSFKIIHEDKSGVHYAKKWNPSWSIRRNRK